MLRAVRECSLVVTVEDHFLTGGLRSILAELLLNRHLTTRVLSVGLDDRWFRPATLQRVLEYEESTGRDIAARILAELDRDRPREPQGHGERLFRTYL